jgi:hypothetical protein
MIAPCIVCGDELCGAGWEGSEPYCNQPSGGTGFDTEGHYGSTVFDPMNGNTLSISVCDDCLVTASEQGRVLLGRDYKPVVSAIDLGDGRLGRPVQVGRTLSPRALVPWVRGARMEQDDEALEIEPEEVGVLDKVEWLPFVATWLTSQKGSQPAGEVPPAAAMPGLRPEAPARRWCVGCDGRA